MEGEQPVLERVVSPHIWAELNGIEMLIFAVGVGTFIFNMLEFFAVNPYKLFLLGLGTTGLIVLITLLSLFCVLVKEV